MTEPVNATTDDEPVLAEGVDDEPVESNRRLFTGRTYILIAAISALYAAFHMFALNGVSIENLTGVDIAFLPQFPMETWNFRIVHITGALGLGFLLFSATAFRADDAEAAPRWPAFVAAALAASALVSGGTALQFLSVVNS
ncbi:MAG: TRAP transporter permease, partial [Pseudomonadota bacterium]